MDLRRFHRTTSLQACILASLALFGALVSNALASREKKLHWLGTPLALPGPVEPARQMDLVPTAPPKGPSQPTPMKPATASPRQTAALTKDQESPAFPTDSAQPIREITGAEAQRAFRLKIPFLDARRSADFLEGHVAGAWCLPVWESDLDTRITVFEASTRASSKDPLLIYCSGGDCEDSHMLASKLMTLGYRNLLIYRAGYPEWSQQGQPIEQGSKP